MSGPDKRAPCHRRCVTAAIAGAARLGHAQRYRYPHDVPEGVVSQQYPPDVLVGRDYYHPARRGAESELVERVAALRAAVRGSATEANQAEKPS